MSIQEFTSQFIAPYLTIEAMPYPPVFGPKRSVEEADEEDLSNEQTALSSNSSCIDQEVCKTKGKAYALIQEIGQKHSSSGQIIKEGKNAKGSIQKLSEKRAKERFTHESQKKETSMQVDQFESSMQSVSSTENVKPQPNLFFTQCEANYVRLFRATDLIDYPIEGRNIPCHEAYKEFTPDRTSRVINLTVCTFNPRLPFIKYCPPTEANRILFPDDARKEILEQDPTAMNPPEVPCVNHLPREPLGWNGRNFQSILP